MFQAIIWDFDGTLVDTYPEIARAVNEALAVFGKTAPLERITELSSVSLDFCITELSKNFAIPKEALNEAFERAYVTVRPESQQPFPGVLEVCKKIQSLGGQNFIVTHRCKKSLNLLLTTHHMHTYFTDIVAGDDGFPKKPDPAAMLHVISKYQLNVDRVLVVGDRDLDILAGQRAGVKTFFALPFLALHPTLELTSFRNCSSYYNSSLKMR